MNTYEIRIRTGPPIPVNVAAREYHIPFDCPAPHTARSRPLATIRAGDNVFGDLTYEFYAVSNDPTDAAFYVLWMADTGSQHDDDQARLYPVAWVSLSHFCEEESQDADADAVSALLYAYLRDAGETLFGGEFEVQCGEVLDQQWLVELVRRASEDMPLWDG